MDEYTENRIGHPNEIVSTLFMLDTNDDDAASPHPPECGWHWLHSLCGNASILASTVDALTRLLVRTLITSVSGKAKKTIRSQCALQTRVGVTSRDVAYGCDVLVVEERRIAFLHLELPHRRLPVPLEGDAG